jgi:hypothetical protein
MTSRKMRDGRGAKAIALAVTFCLVLPLAGFGAKPDSSAPRGEPVILLHGLTLKPFTMKKLATGLV